ncbi:HAAS signaling domain-containing protein [Rummeliibacillus sp. NPDC094406]|uniref:HAAS signaling domain-containing protein n=1 Tax=Rummeliibacillus sp. NPDC094406 TaxID=3364511 RepID=UPI003801B577
MNLIDIYIQEVTKRLPENNREDIALELRSTIEDMLPVDYSEEDTKAVLEKLGSPVTLASGYLDRPMHLIGPRYFDVYMTLLKMILPIAAVISLISMFAEHFIGYSGEQVVINVVFSLIGEGIGRIIEVGIQVFFWLTLVFAILERTDKVSDEQPLTANLKKWTPDDLKNIPYIPKKKAISKGEIFGFLMWTAIFSTLYFYANHLVGVYEQGRDGLEFVTPTFNQEVLLGYWPIVLVVICSQIALALYKLLKGQWTKGIAICNTAVELIATIVFIMILTNPNLMTQDFISYMADLFTTTANQFESWIVSGGIFISILFAVISVFDGFRKSKINMH